MLSRGLDGYPKKKEKEKKKLIKIAACDIVSGSLLPKIPKGNQRYIYLYMIMKLQFMI